MSTLKTDVLKDVAETVSVNVVDLLGASILTASLADDTDPAKGAALVGFVRSTLASAIDTVGEMLSAQTVNIWEYADSVVDKPVPGDPGTWDWSPALQAANDAGVEDILFGAGTYTIKTVSLSHSISITGVGPATILKRAADYELDNVSAGAPTATMLDITAHDSKVTISNLIIDGNEQNQNVNTPSGALIRAYNLAGTTGQVLDIRVTGCILKNQTRGSILVKGNITSTGQEVITITNTLFLDGRPGVGAGDPRSVNPSGFAPFYMNINDKFRLVAQSNSFVFTKTLSGVNPLDYAPGGVRFTRIDATTNATGSTGIISGNYFFRCGRSDKGFDGTPNTNNGLGVIEAYTIGRDIVVSANRFVESQSACVRAKASVDSLSVTGNSMRDCLETGISIGPMAESVGAQTGRIVVSGNVLVGADINGITVVGDISETPNTVNDIIISNNSVSKVTNVTGSAGGNEAAITVRQAKRAIVTGNIIAECNANSGVAGIRVRLCTDTTVQGNRIDGVSSFGIYAQSCEGNMVIAGNALQNSADSGILASQGTSADFDITSNSIGSAVNSAINVATGGYVNIIGNQLMEITGSARGLELGIGFAFTFVTVQGNTTNAATAFFHTIGGNISHAGNSWNPTIEYRAAAPTTLTWRVGDIVYHTAPAASGFIGWVCTTAGTPGTWKTWGAISA